MKEFDFLPKYFHDAARRSRQRRTNMVYLIGLAIALGGFFYSNASRIKSAEASLAVLRTDAIKADMRNVQLETLRAERESLIQRVRLLDYLEDDAPLDAVIGEIARLMSDPMALLSLQVKTTIHKPPDDKKVDPLLCPKTTQVKLVGVAATDVKVGIFFGQLSASPLFGNIAMNYTRDLEEGGRQMREFEFSFLVKPVANDRLSEKSDEVR